MDILTLIDRVKTSIILGESHFREFKSGWNRHDNNQKARDPKSISKDISETLVGFANADGGELLVGVEDDGIITGVDLKEETIVKLLESYKSTVFVDTPLEGVTSHVLNVDGKKILYFMIEKGTRYVHQTSDGRCLQRRDRETIPVSFEKLRFERQEQISREYDRKFVDGAKITDLNIDLVKNASDIVTKGMSVEKCLQYFGLVEYGFGTIHIRRAALLLFAKNINRWHPRNEVRIIRINGTELKTGKDYNVISDNVIGGNIIDLLSLSWEKLRPHLVQTRLSTDAIFREHVMYPEDACREALINAIVHRDFSIEGRNVEILIFDDRMEVQSPGALLSTIRIEDLKKLQGVHQSRNAMIARVLREIGYMREMGEGLRRIFKSMRDRDLIPPELHSAPSIFSIILNHKSVFSDSDQRWLEEYQTLKLTRNEMIIALLGKTGNIISPYQIWDALDIVDTDVYNSIVQQMLNKGVLYRAISKDSASQEAKLGGLTMKSIPQFSIRQPDEIRNALMELFESLGNATPSPEIKKEFLTPIMHELNLDNPYRSDTGRLVWFLKHIGLVDELNKPTQLILEMWKRKNNEFLSEIKFGEVRPDGQQTQKSNTSKKNPKIIYVGNLDPTTSIQELKSLFSKYGKIIHIAMPRDISGQKCRGFAFISMEASPDIESVISDLNGFKFKNKILRVELSLRWSKFNKE